MGLDSPKVSNVIHWGQSASPEDYVQRLGEVVEIHQHRLSYSLLFKGRSAVHISSSDGVLQKERHAF